MNLLIKLKFGSHLYGTNTASSDLDIKGIYLPEAKNIVLQRIEPVISLSRSKIFGEKNLPDDVDQEFYSLDKYSALLIQGQMVALDIFFAPDSVMLTEPRPEWYELKKLAPLILSKKVDSFVRYCKQQANKYGIKGSRVAATRSVLDLLLKAEEKFGSTSKLNMITDQLKKLTENNEHLILGEHDLPNNTTEKYFEICGKKALINTSIKNVILIAKKLVEGYGQRALDAEKNQNIDWKALSHAARAGYQMIEFLQTGHITFPRPEAEYLIAIKQGKILFKIISSEIEELLIKVERAAKNSILTESYNLPAIEDYIEKLYSKIILEHY